MTIMRYSLFMMMMVSSTVCTAQVQSGSKQDSVVQAKVLALLEQERILDWYNEDINTPGDYIYSTQVATVIKQKPGKSFDHYWILVADHTKYDSPGSNLNFYVDPKSMEVYYLDTKTNELWTWANRKKQSRYRRS